MKKQYEQPKFESIMLSVDVIMSSGGGAPSYGGSNGDDYIFDNKDLIR